MGVLFIYFFFQDAPATLLTLAKKKITNIGIFLKVGWPLLIVLNVTLLHLWYLKIRLNFVS